MPRALQLKANPKKASRLQGRPRARPSSYRGNVTPRFVNISAGGASSSTFTKGMESRRVSGQELFCDVLADRSGYITFRSLNPASWQHTRVKTMASTYQNFRIIRLSFDYKPIVATTTAGSISFGVMQMSSANTSEQALTAAPGGFQTPVWNPCTRTLSPGEIRTLQRAPYFSTSLNDKSVETPGVFLRGEAPSVTSGSAVMGKLYIRYEFELAAPALQPVDIRVLESKITDLPLLPSGSTGIITGSETDLMRFASGTIFRSERGIMSDLLSLGKKFLTTIDPTGITNIVIDGISGLLGAGTMETLSSSNADDLPEVTAYYEDKPSEPDVGDYTFDISTDLTTHWIATAVQAHVKNCLVLPNDGTSAAPLYTRLCVVRDVSERIPEKSQVLMTSNSAAFTAQVGVAVVNIPTDTKDLLVMKFSSIARSDLKLYNAVERYFAKQDIAISPTERETWIPALSWAPPLSAFHSPLEGERFQAFVNRIQRSANFASVVIHKYNVSESAIFLKVVPNTTRRDAEPDPMVAPYFINFLAQQGIIEMSEEPCPQSGEREWELKVPAYFGYVNFEAGTLPDLTFREWDYGGTDFTPLFDDRENVSMDFLQAMWDNLEDLLG